MPPGGSRRPNAYPLEGRPAFRRFGMGQGQRLFEPLTEWRMQRLPRRTEGYALDLDSTVVQPFGHQRLDPPLNHSCNSAMRWQICKVELHSTVFTAARSSSRVIAPGWYSRTMPRRSINTSVGVVLAP